MSETSQPSGWEVPGGSPAGPGGRSIPFKWKVTGIVALVLLLAVLGLVALVSGNGSPAATESNGHRQPTLTLLPLGKAPGVVPAPAYNAAGCARPASPGTSSEQMTDQGGERTFVVHVPASYRTGSPVALVLNLHGSGGDGAGQEQYTGMDATSDSAGFIVAYPDATIPDGPGFDWNVPSDPVAGQASAPDDVRFLVDLVSNLEGQFCINPHEVYATGFSRGARMTNLLACYASTTFAAVAPISGVRLPSPCPSSRPVSVLTMHGTLDPTDPYLGSAPIHYWSYSVPAAAVLWATHDGCRRQGQNQQTGPDVTVTTYSGCHAGSSVVLYSLAGTGHAWAGGDNGEPVPPDQSLNASNVIWAFFAAHPMQ